MPNKQLLQAAGDGTAVPAGYVGETKEAATILGYTSTSNTWINASNALTLEAGQWRIEYHGLVELVYTALASVASVRIYNNTDAAEVANSRSAASNSNLNVTIYQHVSNSVVVTLTGTKVFYLQIACSSAAANAKVQMYRNLTGGITGDQDTGKILAVRIA